MAVTYIPTLNYQLAMSSIGSGLETMNRHNIKTGIKPVQDGFDHLKRVAEDDEGERFQASPEGQLEYAVRQLMIAINEIGTAVNDPILRRFLTPQQQDDMSLALLALGMIVTKLKKPVLEAAE